MARVRAWQVLLAHACVAVALAGAVHADGEGLLAKARAEFDALSYGAARTTLSRALATGKNRRGELSEIYRMSGFVAGALGDDAAATEAFKRWLALTPDATLDEGTSPKIARPFAAAKAFFEKHEPLKVSAETNVDPPSVALIVGSDPVGMVKSAKVVVVVDDKPEQTLSAATAPPIAFPLPPGARHKLRVIALDEHGNQLAEIDALMTTRPVEAKEEKPRAVPPPPPPSRAFYARAWLWGAVAIAAGGAGAYFGLEVRSGGDELDALKRDSANHTFSEARALESRMRRNALIANINFGVAGASAIVAGYLFLTRPAAKRERATTVLAPVPLRGGAGAALTRSF